MPLVHTTKMADAHIFSLGKTIGQENHVTCVKLRPRVNFVLRLELLPRHVFSKNTSSSNTLPLFTQILCNGYTLSLQCDVLFIHQQEWKATTWMGLADILFFNIHRLWDFFQSQGNRLFTITKRNTFKHVILL